MLGCYPKNTKQTKKIIQVCSLLVCISLGTSYLIGLGFQLCQYDSKVTSLQSWELPLFYKDLAKSGIQLHLALLLKDTKCKWKVFRYFQISSHILYCSSRTVNFYLKKNKLLFATSGPFTIKYVFLMRSLIWNRLSVMRRTVFIKVDVRQQMWAQPEKSLLLSRLPGTKHRCCGQGPHLSEKQEAHDGAGSRMVNLQQQMAALSHSLAVSQRKGILFLLSLKGLYF